MARKRFMDVVFLIVLGIVLIFLTPVIPFDEFVVFGIAFLKAVT